MAATDFGYCSSPLCCSFLRPGRKAIRCAFRTDGAQSSGGKANQAGKTSRRIRKASIKCAAAPSLTMASAWSLPWANPAGVRSASCCFRFYPGWMGKVQTLHPGICIPAEIGRQRYGDLVSRGLPSVVSPGQIGDLPEAGSAQDAGGNRAAIRGFAMNDDQLRWVELSGSSRELPERNSH